MVTGNNAFVTNQLKKKNGSVQLINGRFDMNKRYIKSSVAFIHMQNDTKNCFSFFFFHLPTRYTCVINVIIRRWIITKKVYNTIICV